ncbi:TonB family protein [Proteus vulgaris]|uniref:TonB family protein n=1 Tax=Proteus vulgaris TaxID=585 RepID=UPI0021B0CEC9|nr:TonB family protein [Proteus vulgaris]MCT6517916.1 TonB family protein [Proteus vulgaris]
MKKRVKLILIIIGIITLLFPFWLPAFLVSTFSLIDSFNSKILPSSVRFDERNFLLGVWVGSLIMTIVMLLQSWRSKNIYYLCGGGLVFLMALSVSFSIIPKNELEDRRRFVLQNIEQSEWKNYHDLVVNSEDDIRKAIRSNQSKALASISAMEKARIALPGLDYFSDDVIDAIKAKEAYFAYAKGTPEHAEAVKTLNFYGDWLLNQPEVMVAQALASLSNSHDAQLMQSGINVIAVAPLSPEAWQVLALTYIAHLSLDAQVEKAMLALMVADTLTQTKQARHDVSVQPLLKKAISELTENQRQIYQILQARVIEDRFYRQNNSPPEEITTLANQRLPVNNAINNDLTTYLEMQSMMGKEYPGKVIVESPNEVKNLTEIRYPTIRKYIPRADVILSVDVNPQGRISGLWVQNSSGIDAFDDQAVKAARYWRFMPNKDGYRQRVTVRFESTRLGWKEYAVKLQSTLIKLVKAYARQDAKGITLTENAYSELKKQAPELKDGREVARSSYDPYASYYPRLSQQQQEKRAALQAILKELQTLPNGKNNHESWDNSIRFLNEKLALYQDNADVVRMVARFELQYYNVGINNLASSPKIYPQDKEYWQTLLLKARTHFEQAIALDPEREDVWLGWGITWLDEDPEIAAGAFAKAAQQKSKESIGSLMQMLEMRMVMETLEGVRLERYQTLRARMDMRYLPEDVEIKPEEDYLSDDLTQIQLTQRAIPASDPNSKVVRSPLNTNKIEQSNRVFSIDFSSANIKGSDQALPKVNAPDTAPKTGDMILQLDVDPQGVPTVVLLKSSSGDMSIDDAVIDAAYQWRFNGSPALKGNVILISVQFSQ